MRDLTLVSTFAGGAAALIAVSFTRDPSVLMAATGLTFLALGVAGCATAHRAGADSVRGRVAEGLALAAGGASILSALALVAGG
jgi:hypothetical protein